MLNSDSYTVAAPTVSITAEDDSEVTFVVNGDYTPQNPSTAIDITDGSGDHEGSIYNDGKKTASLPVRSPAGSDDKPKKFSTFDYQGKEHLITAVNETIGGNNPQAFTLELEILGDSES